MTLHSRAIPRLTTCVLSLLLLSASASGAIRVPDDVGTIDGALSAAVAGDTVLVAPGTYYVNLIWPYTEGIVLKGESGPHMTILDGRDSDQVIGIYTGVDTTTVVCGFTIRNGFAEGQ
jgi:serine protease